MALGATSWRVIGLVLSQAARLTVVCVVIGLGAALVTSRLLTTMLFNVRPNDPVTLGGVVLVLATVTGLATLGAASRAARIAAAVALRRE